MAEISAARINNLHSRIALILGNGAGLNGYGQSVTSYPVRSGSQVAESNDFNFLAADMLDCRIHQIGVHSPEIAEVIKNYNVIAEELSFGVEDDGLQVVDPVGELKGIADLERYMESIEGDKLIVHPTQATLENSITSTRTNPWNGIIYHEFTVNFNSPDHRRHFFNSGGEIRFAANLSGTSSLKGQEWAALLNDIGSVIFNYTFTESTGIGSGSQIGNYDLNEFYQVIFEKLGSTGVSSYAYAYAGISYTVKARAPVTGSQIQFRIEFNDFATDGSIDENIDGTLTSIIQQYRATGDHVEVPTPSYTNNNTLQ
jgi:hypothetical protein